MNEFTKRLTAIRQGAKGAVKKGADVAGKVAKGIGDRQERVRKAKEDQGNEMIRKNFGSEENYRDRLDLDSKESKKLFTPTYQKAGMAAGKAVKGAGSMLSRLMRLRGGQKEPWGPENQ